MSIETHVMVSASFPDQDSAKSGSTKLKRSLKENQHELASALDAINPVENQHQYSDVTIDVEDISRKKSVLSIFAYTYTSEEPIWFAKSIYELGANKVYIRSVSDGHARNYYFLDGKKVPKSKYHGDKPQKKRSLIKAKLITTWDVGDEYERIGLKLETLEGDIIYHIGTGKLVSSYYNKKAKKFDNEVLVEFSATIERGKLEGENVSFAKRPTKIVVHNNT